MARWIWFAALIVVVGGPVRADEPSTQPAPIVDEEAARQYNRFRDEFDRGMERTVTAITQRYGLQPEQTQAARRLVDESAGAFLREHGQTVFDLFQRMRALRGFMREERMRWDEIPQEIKQDLAERALPMIDAVQKQLGGFSEDFGKLLDPSQQERLERDRERMETGFRMARLQARIMSGRGVVGDIPAGRRPETTRPAPANVVATYLDRWERYAERFIREHRLDEIQKLRVMDLLKQYKAKARGLAGKRPGPASTQPAAKGSAEAFRRRLDVLRAERRPVRALFEQFKAELDKIPSPVQRKLAEEDRAGARGRGGPVRQDAAPPGATTR